MDNIPNAPHQHLVDGLNLLLLEGHISKLEAIEYIQAYEDQPDEIDEAVLWQLRKDLGI